MFDYFDDNKFKYAHLLSPEVESLKPEESFIINEFLTTARYTDTFSIAFKVRHLILMERGTNPSNVRMGVGLRNYIFEFDDSETLITIEEEINKQVNEFIPNDVISSIKVYNSEMERRIGNKALLVVIGFGKKMKDDIKEVALKFGVSDENRKKLISTILY